MKLYAPKYYSEFKCIADKCRHSCCVGWEIDIDGETMQKYLSAQDFPANSYSVRIKDSIDMNETPHFRLCEGERCPHLRDDGLCKIILQSGEDFLCNICREHPRFYNDTSRGKEVGLGLCCEEACSIALRSDDYDKIIPIGEEEGEDTPCKIDTVALRSYIYSILKNDAVTHSQKLQKIYNEFGVSPASMDDNTARELIHSLEYMDDGNREMFCAYSSSADTPEELHKPLERALAYFVFRHCTEAQDETEYRAALGFCLFCERLLASVATAQGINTFDGFAELARIVSEELEYSEQNTADIKFEFEIRI